MVDSFNSVFVDIGNRWVVGSDIETLVMYDPREEYLGEGCLE